MEHRGASGPAEPINHLRGTQMGGVAAGESPHCSRQTIFHRKIRQLHSPANFSGLSAAIDKT
jgi:hypothetical protein